MSLDTATKRRSMFAMGVLALVVHPVPDATIAAIDQKHFLGLMAAVATTVGSFNIHKYSTGPVQPNHASDSGDNILVAGVVEAQDGGYFGGASDYAKFAADGELTLTGTARVIRHMHFTMELGKGQSAPTERYDEDPFVSYTYAINDDSHITREAPTDMDYTVDSVVKIHWYTTDPTANGDGDEVRWEVQWASRAPGEDITTGDTFGNTGNIVCPVQYIIAETAVVTIPANSIVEGDSIGLHLQRMAIAGGTNPTVGTIHVVHIEFEYTSNKLGGAT